jgi:hypothetical protein
MSESTRKKIKLITPRGVFQFPKLNKPDTKFKAEGQYTVKSRIAADAEGWLVGKSLLSASEITEALTELRDEFHAEVVQKIKAKEIGPKWNPKEREAKLAALKVADIFTPETDAAGEETGNILFHAKMIASGVSKKDQKKWTRSPLIFDAKRKKMSPVPAIFGGTEGKVAAEAMAYFAPGTKEAPPVVGVTFYLEAVQILKLVKAGDKSADSFGFGEEEGYEDVADEGGEQFAAGDEGTSSDSDGGAAPSSGAEF